LNDPALLIGAREVNIPDGSGFLPQRLLVLRYGLDGVFRDTAMVLPFGELGVINVEARLAGGPLFESRGLFAASGDFLYSADGSDASIAIRTPALELVRSTRWLPPGRAVTAADVEQFKRERLEGLNGDMLKLMRQRYESVPVSRAFPAMSDLLPGPSGGVWVRSYQRPAIPVQTWWQFDQSGAFQCALTLPENTKVLQFDVGTILAVTPDELGTEYVSVLKVERRES
jgi:hypothetical protein